MFTDFLAECRAHKMQLQLRTGDVMSTKQEIPQLASEQPQLIAAAA